MIQIDRITKTFGEIRSLDDVSVSVESGSIFGLIGSNGSGKSTLLRILCGIFAPDSGSIAFDGRPVWENVALKAEVVYLSDKYHDTDSSIAARKMFDSAGISYKKYTPINKLGTLPL